MLLLYRNASSAPIKHSKKYGTSGPMKKSLSDGGVHEDRFVDVEEMSSLKGNEFKYEEETVETLDKIHEFAHQPVMPTTDDHATDVSSTINSLNLLANDGFYSKKDINSLDELRRYANWYKLRNFQNGQAHTEPIAKTKHAKVTKNTTVSFAKSRSDRRFNKSVSVYK